MATVNFRCGHCNNLMGVGAEFLGQQVRCPHCQNVVVAPAPVAAPTPAPVEPKPPEPAPMPAPSPAGDVLFSPAPAHEHEDIFAEGDRGSDSLFDEPMAPRLEVPPPDLPPAPMQEPAAAFAAAPAPAETPPPAWMPPPSENGQAVTAEPHPPEPGPDLGSPGPRRATAPREPGKVNWFIPLVFMPVLLWALLATGMHVVLYVQRASAPKSRFQEIFEEMPDVQGDATGVRSPKVKAQIFQFTPKQATAPLPANLKVALGKPIPLGDLEVTPTRLERRHVNLLNERGGDDARPEPSPHESLVLHLRLKSLATDYAFTPLDNFFDRKYKPGASAVPLTLLEAGPVTFFGGPANWAALDSDRNRAGDREWLEGRKNIDRVGLQPGETQETYVCTDGWDPAVSKHLFGLDADNKPAGQPYSGPLLWRVQLRRGLIAHAGKRLSATGVIGVEFTSKDVPAGGG